jgi:hypothetical protein
MQYNDPEFGKTEFKNLSGKNILKPTDYSAETKNSSAITNGLFKKEIRESENRFYLVISIY